MHYYHVLLTFYQCSVLQVNNGKRRKSTRLAKKEVKHYEEPVISDDDDYICMSYMNNNIAVVCHIKCSL